MQKSFIYFHFALVVYVTAQIMIAQEKTPKHKQPTSQHNQMFAKPHEQYFNELDQQQPTFIKPPPAAFTPSKTSSIYPNVNISTDTFPQNEPSVMISRKNPNNVVAAWRDFRTGVTPAVRRVGYSFSTDGGATWAPSSLLPRVYQFIGYTRNSDPVVCVDTSGNFFIATLALNDNDGNGKILVYELDSQGEFVQLASFAPSDTSDGFYDKEYITCDLSSTSPFSNNLYIAWSGTRFTRSTDEGITWSQSLRISDSAQIGIPDLCVRPNGDVDVVWWDGNRVLFDKSTDGGLTFGTDEFIDSTLNLDIQADSGLILSPGFPSIATDPSSGPRRGNLYITYTDGRNGDFDVFLKYSTDGGSIWSPPKRVNNDPIGNGKFQFWPWMTVDDRGNISIVFYDTRNTPRNSITETYLAYSIDGGRSFTNVLLSSQESPRNIPSFAVRFGDYIGIDAWGGHIVPVWTDERAGNYDMEVYTTVIDSIPNPIYSGIEYSLTKNWNLVSLPLSGDDPTRNHLFPTATSSAFAYEGFYVAHETLSNGTGYWIKFASNQYAQIIGDSLFSDTVSVSDGWNMIGSITESIPVSSIVQSPPNIVVSPYFGYDGGYVASSTIDPGKGYWVKSSGAGSLVLSAIMTTEMLAQARHSRVVDPATFHEIPPSPPEKENSTQPAVPTSYVLEQNYPNPFNPTTRINYELPQLSRVRLVVFDILGRKVEVLIDATEEPGRYSVSWDATNMPGGVYFYRLSAGNVSETKKILLLR